MKNKYDELREIHQKRVNEFPLMFAFNQEQFDNGMKNWGLEPSDTDKIYSIGGGGYIRKTDLDTYNKLWEDIRKEHNELIEKDKTGAGYIKDMFISELENHEYSYTRDISSTLDALELTYEDIRNNPTLKKGLALAINEIIENKFYNFSDFEKIGLYALAGQKNDMYSLIKKELAREPSLKYSIRYWPVMIEYKNESKYQLLLK